MSSGHLDADPVRALLLDLLGAYRDNLAAAAVLRDQLARLDQPLRVAVAGVRSTGKSTLVSAMAGDRVAPAMSAGPNRSFTYYTDGPSLRVLGQERGEPAYDIGVTRTDDGLRWDSARTPDRVLVETPARTLRDLTLIDTPPLRQTNLTWDDPVVRGLRAEADAVVYLAAHPGPRHVAGLREPRSTELAEATAVHSMLALSRADEVSAGRIDALQNARLIARRSRREQSCAGFQNVVAVSGTVGLAARTLRDDEFADLRAIAAVPRSELERFLISADTFVTEDFPAAIAPGVRLALARRWGLFGVRLARTLIRSGSDTPIALSAQLTQRCGLSELRDTIGDVFGARRSTLKMRSALLAIESVLRADRRAPERFVVRLERLAAGAHGFREMRLLADLAADRVRLPEELAREASRLLGADGTGVLERLELPADADARAARAAALTALDRWRATAETAATAQEHRDSAHVVVRSCEGILAELAPAPAS